LANFTKIVERTNRHICIGGFVTLLARAIGLHAHLNQLKPFGAPLTRGFRYLDLTFCFNRSIIGNLGSAPYQLKINYSPIDNFTLPNPEKTSILDKNNWLYDLEKQNESEPPVQPAESSNEPKPQVDHAATIANMETKIESLNARLVRFMTIVSDQFKVYHNILDNTITEMLILERLSPTNVARSHDYFTAYFFFFAQTLRTML
jgi:hypothetical protein